MIKRLAYILPIAMLFLVTACQHGPTSSELAQIDSLNARAYHLRYVNIDSVSLLATQALSLSEDYPDGRNEARNNLAYVKYQQMDFDGVDSILSLVRDDSGNPFLLLCADVMQMKACQRIGNGQQFYAVKTRAENRMQRINRRLRQLTPRQLALLVYARSEFFIISSTYDYYQEQDSMARTEIAQVPPCFEMQVDTAQWIYYNYMMGSGGLVQGEDARDVTLQEFDYLFHALMLSTRERMPYFQANALQSLAVMFLRNEALLQTERTQACRILAAMHSEGDTLTRDLPMVFCRRALQLFQDYDDLFQTACTYRTLGEINFERGSYDAALAAYTQALHCVNVHHLRYYGATSPDTLSAFNPDALQRSVETEWIADSLIATVPDWIAGIRQQFSLTFSALGLKQASDYNRNFYLDLIQSTNQNQELENRMQVLKRQNRALYFRMLLALLLTLVTVFLFRARLARVREEKEETEERLQVSHRQMMVNKRKNAENRAKVSLVHAIMPYLDRIGGEVRRMQQEGAVNPDRLTYIQELIDEIDRINKILTEWIQMEQGQLSLHISTFPLARLFAIVAEGHYAFDQKQVRLVVEPVEASVKADESLTLFMLNTLADNARKFTPAGGTVTLSAEATDEFVEIRVRDTGCGLTPEEVDMITHNKVYDASQIGSSVTQEKGFGFGLMNCRGIIEKYKKTSSLFSSCAFGVHSEVGQGSTFYFRLPRVLRLLALLLLFPAHLLAQKDSLSALDSRLSAVDTLSAVETLYEATFQANVDGRYADAVTYAQAALDELNQAHPRQRPLLLNDSINPSVEIADVLWAQRGVDAPYTLMVNLRNEVALAALALHEWNLYHYNNRACIRLHRFIHQDKTLPHYYHRLERTHRNSNLLLAFIILLGVAVVVLVYRRIYPVHKLRDDTSRMADEQTRLHYEQNRLYVQNQVLDNCLSTIKHESMFYPSRIRLLAGRMQDADIPQLAELVDYYRHIYTLLSAQADAQVSQPGFRRQHVALGDFQVLADPTLLDMLIDSLRKGMSHEGAALRQEIEADGAFVRVSLYDDSQHLTDQQLTELFFPSPSHIPFLIAKQILREHDTYCNHPGLRLVAESTPAGYKIYFTMLKIEN